MDGWLRSIGDALSGPLRPVIDAVASRLTALWAVVSTFLRSVANQWHNLRTRVTTWAAAQVRHALAVATTLRWLTFTYIPRKINELAISVKTWAGDLITKVEKKAASLFNAAIDWATVHIQSALNLISSLRTWAIGQFNSLLSTVSRMAKLVFGPLSTPEKLAEWVAAAMWDALVRFARANAHRAEAFIVRERMLIWRMVISVIEDVFTELL